MKTRNNIVGLILAAGKSERMGNLKPLLPIGNQTFLSRLFQNIEPSKLSDWRLVLGYCQEEILQKSAVPRGQVIYNPEYETGQLSSLIYGLRNIDWDKTDGVMVFLIDHPLISTSLIDLLIQEFSDSRAPIIIPSYHGKRGHPVIFRRCLFQELSTAPLDQGAVAIVRRHQNEIMQVPVEDEGVIVDVDTPFEYENLLQRLSALENGR